MGTKSETLVSVTVLYVTQKMHLGQLKPQRKILDRNKSTLKMQIQSKWNLKGDRSAEKLGTIWLN